MDGQNRKISRVFKEDEDFERVLAVSLGAPWCEEGAKKSEKLCIKKTSFQLLLMGLNLESQNAPPWVKCHATFIYHLYSCFSIQIFEAEIRLLYSPLLFSWTPHLPHFFLQYITPAVLCKVRCYGAIRQFSPFPTSFAS